MIFKPKEVEKVKDMKFGDVVVFEEGNLDDSSVALVTDVGRGEAGLVFLGSGYLSCDYSYDNLKDLKEYLDKNHSKHRVIPSSKLEIVEL